MPDSLAEKVKTVLEDKRLFLTTAESCTGGLIGVAMTDIPGSSRVYDRGFITYSNQAKMDLLKVSGETLEDYGAVSEETATEMSEGALKAAPQAHVAVAVTGIAGPDGGTDHKPVGLVYISIAHFEKETQTFKHIFKGDRNAVRKQTVDAAFEHILEILNE